MENSEIAIPPLWDPGIFNPSICAVREERGDISFSCRTCREEVVVPFANLDERRGALWGCGDSCHDHFYVHGKNPDAHESKGQRVTSGVLVSIQDFASWYVRHPVHVALGDESWMLNEHGLWAFCAVCDRQIISTVLCAFVEYHLASSLGIKGHIFNASTIESTREMEALHAGACQECGSRRIIAIMADIAQDHRADIRRWQVR